MGELRRIASGMTTPELKTELTRLQHLRDELRRALSKIANDFEYDFDDKKSVLATLDRVRAIARDAFEAS